MNCRADAVSEVADYGTFGSSTLIMPKPTQIAMLSVRFDADRAGGEPHRPGGVVLAFDSRSRR